MRSSQAAIDAPLVGEEAPSSRPGVLAGLARLGGLGRLGMPELLARLRAILARLSDTQLSLTISVALFALSAWPLALTDVPPYQDLPNHLAALTVMTHPAQYPEFVFNGFLKTNAALFTWLYFVSKVAGVALAAKLFALLVIALNAVVFPLFVLRVTGSRQKLVVASLLIWPMTHNWFVSMGMLDFACSVPLALATLLCLLQRSRAPTARNALLSLGLALLTWYAHVFGVLVVHLIVGLHVVTRASMKERVAQAKVLLLPLLPVTILATASLYQHVTERGGEMTGYMALDRLLPPWELAYNLWAEWMWGFTKLSITSFVPSVAIALLFFVRRKEEVPFFSRAAFVVLLGFFVFTPYIATNWFHVNSRFIPFLWAAAILRVPPRLPRWAVGLMAVSAVLYSAGMGVDYVRLDRDRAKFTAGIQAVPQGAKLLPLLFKRQITSENTRSLLHAWGFYVTEKETSAPLLFAHSSSFPVMYRDPPAARFNHLVLESFAPTMSSPHWMCDILRSAGIVVDDCDAEWRSRWSEFWKDAMPRYDHLLLWDAPAEVQAIVPPAYRVIFREDRLLIYERVDAKVASRLQALTGEAGQLAQE